jgi:hypothetical protein
MRRSVVTFALSAVTLMLTFTFAGAQQSGTAVEAQAMFDRAVAAVKADKAKALSEFNDKNNKQFHDRDLTSSATTCRTGNSRRILIRPSWASTSAP